MKKKDIILIVAILLVAGGALLALRFFSAPVDEDTAEVVVSVRGSEYGRYPLNKNQTIVIPATYGENTIVVKDGQVTMTEAGCPDQICVYHAPITVENDFIICLPNQIIVEIVGGEENKLDGVAQ